jgi:hypothetical protein
MIGARATPASVSRSLSTGPNFSIDQRDGAAPVFAKSVSAKQSGQGRPEILTYSWPELWRLRPGNAILPIGGLRDAIQENGVPG